MKAIDFPEANKTLTKPENMTDAECHSLRVFCNDDKVVSCWQLSPEEIELLQKNDGKIWLWIWSGATQPPVSLQVENPFGALPKDGNFKLVTEEGNLEVDVVKILLEEMKEQRYPYQDGLVFRKNPYLKETFRLFWDKHLQQIVWLDPRHPLDLWRLNPQTALNEGLLVLDQAAPKEVKINKEAFLRP